MRIIKSKRLRAARASILVYSLLLYSQLPHSLLAAEPPPPNFEDHVLPIFRRHCNGCHNPDRNTADLDLTTYKGALKGSSGGEVVKAGVPDTSRLYEAITHADGVEAMPPKKPKTDPTDLRKLPPNQEEFFGGLAGFFF